MMIRFTHLIERGRKGREGFYIIMPCQDVLVYTVESIMKTIKTRVIGVGGAGSY
jgi:hypothetical protein